MPAAEVAGLRAMPDDRLRQELEETLRALFNLRFQAATRQLADVSQVRAARRRAARIRTLLRERDLLIDRSHAAVAAPPPEETETPSADGDAKDLAPAGDGGAPDDPAGERADAGDLAPAEAVDAEAEAPDGADAEAGDGADAEAEAADGGGEERADGGDGEQR